MKKLAIALMCFVSVAFFASCNPNVENPEPSVSFYAAEGYVSTDVELNAGDSALFGLTAKSNTETLRLLKTFTFQVMVGDSAVYEFTKEDINEMNYSYDVNYLFESEGTYTVKATVVDGAEKTATASVVVTVVANMEATPFTWERTGATPGTGLDAFGLQWTGNVKVIHAVIKPLEGATLYQFNSEVWDATTTQAAKEALFTDAQPIDDFREISVEATADYDFVLGTNYNNEYHLIHITHATVTNDPVDGTTVVITGEAK